MCKKSLGKCDKKGKALIAWEEELKARLRLQNICFGGWETSPGFIGEEMWIKKGKKGRGLRKNFWHKPQTQKFIAGSERSGGVKWK